MENRVGRCQPHLTAWVWPWTSRYAEAEASFLQALAVREALYGPKSYTLIPILHNLAWVYAKEGKVQEAAAVRRRANSIDAHP